MSGMTLVDRAHLYAVASRSRDKAEAFQTKYHAEKALDSYEALVTDPQVDIVYVATPHPMHLRHAQMALMAGKHVLVEKPVCVNIAELDQLQQTAQRQGCFVMEAMWTRFFPANLQVVQWLRQGRIGRLRQVQAAFAYGSQVGDGKAGSTIPSWPVGRLWTWVCTHFLCRHVLRPGPGAYRRPGRFRAHWCGRAEQLFADLSGRRQRHAFRRNQLLPAGYGAALGGRWLHRGARFLASQPRDIDHRSGQRSI